MIMASRVYWKLQQLLLLIIALHYCHGLGPECVNPATRIPFTYRKANCEQPLYYNILPKTEENLLLDNICGTVFPLPDDPSTFTTYLSYVYCDGSNYVESYVGTEHALGENVLASPTTTGRYYFIGYAGCETYVGYRCTEFGEPIPPFLFGLAYSCEPIGLSCLRKVKELVSEAGLPDQELYALPMKLPNRCVTQQICLLDPPNPFYNKIPPHIGLV